MMAFGCCEKAANGRRVCLELMEAISKIREEIYVCRKSSGAFTAGPHERRAHIRAVTLTPRQRGWFLTKQFRANKGTFGCVSLCVGAALSCAFTARGSAGLGRQL